MKQDFVLTADFNVIIALSERVKHSIVFIQRAAELVKIGNFLLTADTDSAVGRLQFAQNQLEEGGFTDTVWTD